MTVKSIFIGLVSKRIKPRDIQAKFTGLSWVYGADREVIADWVAWESGVWCFKRPGTSEDTINLTDEVSRHTASKCVRDMSEFTIKQCESFYDFKRYFFLYGYPYLSSRSVYFNQYLFHLPACVLEKMYPLTEFKLKYEDSLKLTLEVMKISRLKKKTPLIL